MTERKSIFKLFVAEVTGFALNVVPLALWLFEDYSNEAVMLLYLLECIITVVFTTFCFVLLVPAEERFENRTLRRNKILADFLWVVGGCVFILPVLILAFMFIAFKGEVPPAEHIKTGLTIILAFQLFEFFTNLYLLRPFSLRKGEFFLGQSMGGFVLLMISMFPGFIVAFLTGKNYWFVLIFVILKTVIDIITPIRFLLGKSPAPEADPLHRHVTYKKEFKFRGKRMKG